MATQVQAQGINYTILRFNFSEKIMNHIAYFAKLHQFEDRQTYKTNWIRWYEENHTCLDEEIQRLEENGYDGDVQDKMYKAGRYYFRKKNVNDKPGNDKPGNDKPGNDDKQSNDDKPGNDVKKKKLTKYTTMSKTILEEMNTHILTSMRNDNAYTPAKGYTEFCERYAPLLVVETERLKLTRQIDEEDITKKIKKTYKNRYFILTR